MHLIDVHGSGERRAQGKVPNPPSVAPGVGIVCADEAGGVGQTGALVYGGLMDYRALAGEGTPALLLAEESPLRWGEEVLASLGKPVENIVGQIDGLQRQAALHREGD